MKDFNEEQRAAIRQLLQADIDKSVVEERKGMSYVPGFYPKDQLNVIFGADGWSSETLRAELVVPPKANEKGQHECVWMCTVRISAMGTFRDGSACGSGNKKQIGESMHDALGEAETDALKRAACLWGRHLGLALYDKEQRFVSETLDPRQVHYGPHKGADIRKASTKGLADYLGKLPKDCPKEHRSAVEAELSKRIKNEERRRAEEGGRREKAEAAE